MIKFEINKSHVAMEIKGSGDIIASEVMMANMKLTELMARMLNVSVGHASLFMMQECNRLLNAEKERSESND